MQPYDKTESGRAKDKHYKQHTVEAQSRFLGSGTGMGPAEICSFPDFQTPRRGALWLGTARHPSVLFQEKYSDFRPSHV